MQINTEYTYGWSSVYVYIVKGVQMKSDLHTGTWSAAAWLSCHLCYGPALFRYLHFIVLSLPQGKTLCVF